MRVRVKSVTTLLAQDTLITEGKGFAMLEFSSAKPIVDAEMPVSDEVAVRDGVYVSTETVQPEILPLLPEPKSCMYNCQLSPHALAPLKELK